MSQAENPQPRSLDLSAIMAAISAAVAAAVSGATANLVPYTGSIQPLDMGLYHSVKADGSLGTPISGVGTINYGSGSYYNAWGFTHGIRIYAYKEHPLLGRMWSRSYLELTVSDDSSSSVYDISWNWDAIPEATGYFVLKYDSQNGYNWDHYADIGGATSFSDGSSGYFNPAGAIVSNYLEHAFNSYTGGAWFAQEQDMSIEDIDILKWGGGSGSMIGRMAWEWSANQISLRRNDGSLMNLNVSTMTAQYYFGMSYMSNYGSSYGTQYGPIWVGGSDSAMANIGGYLTRSTTLMKRSVRLDVQQAKLPVTNPARIDSSDQNFRLLFDDTTSQSALWQFQMPSDYGSSLVLRLHFSMNGTQVGSRSIIMRSYIAAITPDVDTVDVNTKTFASANSSTKSLTFNQVAGYVKSLGISMTNTDSLAASDFVMLKIDRDASNASDTATGDLELIAVTLEYNSSL